MRRWMLISLWLGMVAAAIWIFFVRRDLLTQVLLETSSRAFLWGAMVYLAVGCLRGFTLIPSTMLVFLALPFFRAGPLFLLTLAGILVSSTSIYWFAEALHLDDVFEALHGERLRHMRAALARYELPFIILWSFLPVAPTDLICYVCGVVGVRYSVCAIGVLIGEGAICGVYIFTGDALLRTLHLRM